MSFDTYSNLKTAIINWSHRSDLLTLVDDFIDLCEADLWKRLRTRDMEKRATAAAPTSGRFLALPDSFIQMRRLKLESGGTTYELQYRTPEAMQIKAETARPRHFTISSQIEFDRTPDAAYTVEMQYYISLTALSDSNTSNAVLTRFPQLYLYGSLYHLYTYTAQEDKAVLYNKLFDDLIETINSQEEKGRHGPAPAMRYEGSTP
jgi:hypothetical protein